MAKLTCGLTIPGVTEKDGRYYKIVSQGKIKKWRKLTRIDEGVSALLRSLADFDPFKPDTIGELIALYRAMGMDSLKPATQVDYLRILLRLEHHFGHMRHRALKPNQCAHFLEVRRKAGRGATRANREMAVLSSVFNFGMRNLCCDHNPAKGIDRNEERPKSFAPNDAQFLDVFNRANEAFQDLIAADFLSGARQTDIIAWSRTQHMRADGLHYVESKTEKKHWTEWSDALRFFVERAMNRFPHEDLIFLNPHGRPWTTSAIASQLARLKSPWCFKDLRAKAQTDSPHSVLGHGAALEAVYRKEKRTRPVR